MGGRPDWKQQSEFLIRLYFGENEEKNGFIGRAYRDFARTLRGLRAHPRKDEMKAQAGKCLRTSLLKLAGMAPRSPERLREEFDCWHSDACTLIIECFSDFEAFNYGQAQKWLNMTIKYRWFFSERDPLNEWFKVAHVAVDDYVLRAANESGVSPPVPLPWSKWDASAYFCFQNRVREHAAQRGMTPLQMEHYWWMSDGDLAPESSF